MQHQFPDAWILLHCMRFSPVTRYTWHSMRGSHCAVCASAEPVVTPPVTKQRQVATPQTQASLGSSAAATPSATPTFQQAEAQQAATPAGPNGMAGNGLSAQATEVFVRELRALAALEVGIPCLTA